MKSIKRKITLVSVLGFAVVALGVSLILYSDFEKETAARYAFPTQASTTFETGSFFFDCDGEAIAYPGQHDGQVMELELGHDLVSPSIDIDVKNFVGTNYTAQDVSYIVSISDGTNSNHVNYDFSINDAAVGSSDVSQPRTISGDNASTDTISLKFNRTNNNVGGDTINIKIKSLAPYEKEIVFQIRIILPEITVSFDAKGGTVSPETTEVRYLSTYGTGTGLTDGQLPIPTREGYYFNGWYGTGDDFSPSTYAVPGGLNGDVYDHFLNKWQADGYNSFSEAVSNHWYQYGSSPKEGRQARSGKVSADNYNYNYDNNEESKLYAMWVPTSRTVKVVSPTSNAQTINCSTAGGQTIINNSTSQTSSGTVNLLDEGGDYLSVTFSCSISAAGYKTYNTGNISVGSYNFIYNENNPSTPGTYTLSPSLTPETYTVSFDAAGGSVNPSSKQVTYLSNYGTLPTPTRAHYTFGGWYLNGAKITENTTNNQTANHTLTASWIYNPTVTFNTNGGNAVSPASFEVQQGATYSTGLSGGDFPTPTQTHYEFLGWFYSLDDTTPVKSSDINTRSEDFSLIAKWQSTARTITLTSNAVKTYDGDQQILQCKYVDESKNPGGNSMIYSVQTMPSSGTQSASTTPTSAIPYYYDDGEFECNVTADGYIMAYERFSYGDTSIASKEVKLNPTTAPDISGPYFNSDKNSAATGTLINYRNGYYLIEMWGGQGGHGNNNGSKDGGLGGAAGHVYGIIELGHEKELAYSLGGNGNDGTNAALGVTNLAGGANNGGIAAYDGKYKFIGGSGGGWSTFNDSNGILLLAGGGGGGSGPGGSSGGQTAAIGGNGGSIGSATGSYGTGTVFYGTNGGCGAQGCGPDGNDFVGTAGTTTAGWNNHGKDYQKGDSLKGGNARGRGGAGGAGLFGGGGGYSNNDDNIPKKAIYGHSYTTGGGGGSSYVDGSVQYDNLPSKATQILNSSANPSTNGGGLIITYLGKSL